MKFVDNAEITVAAGNGGQGCVSFRREKYVPKGGPDGGDGGQGGNIVLKSSHNIQTLLDLKLKKSYKAQHGEQGSKKNKFGKNGQNLIITVPTGCMIFDENDTLLKDFQSDHDTFIAAKGGKGGKGNQHFASAKNKIPRYAQPGLPGESKKLRIELKLIAEVGLVGLPNAGKSTLLQALTRANPKIASYPFTTLYPNLGVLKLLDKEIIIADIPGLIEGASRGEGLGHEFMRHVERTKCLIHLIDASHYEDPNEIFRHYQTICSEIKLYSEEILKRPMLIILNKSDLLTKEQKQEVTNTFINHKCKVLLISALKKEGLDLCIKEMVKCLQESR